MYSFIDESGDHNLDLSKSDNNYNIFVLGAVLIEKINYKTIDEEFRKFKKDFFGSEDFIIHTDELTRPMGRKSDPRNKILRVKEKRAEFYNWMNDFILRSNLKAVFSVIRKEPLIQQYRYPLDPYEMGFENLLNRTLYYSKSTEIEIYPECRNSDLDSKLLAEYTKYSIAGTKFHTSRSIQERVKKFECKDKKENMTGLQIADLLVSPVGRHFLGKQPKPAGNEVTYATVREKLAGSIGISLKVFP